MKKIVPDPPASTLQPDSGQTMISFEDQLNHAWDLLRCANATAYECGDALQGAPRDLAMATTHLIELAQSVIEQIIDHLPSSAEPAAVETSF